MIEQLHIWYSRADVKFQIISYLYNREFSLLVPSWVVDEEKKKCSIRTLRCHNVQSFDYILNKGIRMFEKQIPFNFYYSLAKYKNGIPYQTFNLSKRDNSDFIKNHYKEMISYDFLIDIDAGEHEDIYYALDSALEIIKLFDKCNCPYEIRFSGKGFHIIIPYEYFNDMPKKEKSCFMPLSLNPKDDNSIYKFYSKTAKFFEKEFSEMIDTKIYDSRRLCKLPYSLSVYKELIYVAYPFAGKIELDNFSLDNFELSRFNFIIKDKKRKIFNEEGNIKLLLEKI